MEPPYTKLPNWPPSTTKKTQVRSDCFCCSLLLVFGTPLCADPLLAKICAEALAKEKKSRDAHLKRAQRSALVEVCAELLSWNYPPHLDDDVSIPMVDVFSSCWHSLLFLWFGVGEYPVFASRADWSP